jgi:hypothetical protein
MQQHCRMLDPTPRMLDERIHLLRRRPHLLEQQRQLGVHADQEVLRFRHRFPELYQ